MHSTEEKAHGRSQGRLSLNEITDVTNAMDGGRFMHVAWPVLCGMLSRVVK